jgi:DNA repair exonuclease SbcCD ATPase subunit
LIVGKNGAGKSTITDAITYGLYGKAFRNINKPQLINSLNQKNMVVEVIFKIGTFRYRVVRGMKPNIFEIYQNDKIINQDAASRDYQEVLEKQILKMTYKSFCQVVILGSASFVPFMGLPTGQRRAIIEDILDLEIFSRMNVILKDKVGSNATLVKDAEYEIKMIDQRIKLQKQHLETMMKDVDGLIADLNSKISHDSEHIQQLFLEISENNSTRESMLENVNDDPSKLTTRLSKLNTYFAQLNKKIATLNNEISFLKDNDNCPTCQQEISQTFKCEHIDIKKTAISETEAGLDKVKEEVQKAQTNLNEINEVYRLCTELNVENNVAMSTITALENSIKNHKNDIDKLKEKRESFTTDGNSLVSLDNEKKSLETKKMKLLSEKELYNVALVILKDSGIKAKIIKQYIPIINKYINKYLSAMDFFVSFELDENFKETIKSRFRDEFSFESFSEGEKSRISLCILFTWRTVAKLRNSAATNLLIFDEIFDGSLDGDGTEEFMKILDIAAPESNVIVISHKTDAMLDRFDRVLKFEKVKNFSQLVD